MIPSGRPQMGLDHHDHIIEYVAGPMPYYWIGDGKGGYYGSIYAKDLKRFVNAPLKSSRPVGGEEA